MIRLLLACWLWLLPAGVLGQGWTLTPSRLAPGDVALLRWQGPAPALSVVQFDGRLLYPQRTDQGPLLLLGIDLETAPGTYPLVIALVDRQGKTLFTRLDLIVDPPPVAPEQERLSLPKGQVAPRKPQVLQRIRNERRLLQELFAHWDSPPTWSRFDLPVDGDISSPFGRQRLLNGKVASAHAGVDFRGQAGTPVRVSGGGRVAFVGELFYTGRTVVVDHGDGLFSLYAHLQTSTCRTGQDLLGDTVLGTVGSSGRATGPHLHWSMRLRGARINPLALVSLSRLEKR